MQTITTVDAFKSFVKKIESIPGYRQPIGFGIARVQWGQKTKDKPLTMRFPFINWKENSGSAAIFQAAAGIADVKKNVMMLSGDASSCAHSIDGVFVSRCTELFAPYLADARGDAHKNVQAIKALGESLKEAPDAFRLVMLYDDKPIANIYEAYIKLLALSSSKAAVNSLNLSNIFSILPNVVWSGDTAYEIAWLKENEIELVLSGKMPGIDFVDKFPRLLQQFLPPETVRILDTSRVRAGAQLAAGTTIMPGAAYINFNAGTLGKVMVEGRISQGVVVGANSDIGGGASTLGTLSGGNSAVISVGERCLLGANAVLGIPLGDGCTIDAGVTVLGGTKVAIDDAELQKIISLNPEMQSSHPVKTMKKSETYILKAADLANLRGLHIRADSQSGQIRAMHNKKEIALNQALHGAT